MPTCHTNTEGSCHGAHASSHASDSPRSCAKPAPTTGLNLHHDGLHRSRSMAGDGRHRGCSLVRFVLGREPSRRRFLVFFGKQRTLDHLEMAYRCLCIGRAAVMFCGHEYPWCPQKRSDLIRRKGSGSFNTPCLPKRGLSAFGDPQRAEVTGFLRPQE
jgi:hypothetical protein